MRTPLAALTLVAIGAFGCEPQRRNVTLNWTFAGGQSCRQVGVATIEVDIAGELLSPNQFDCTDASGAATTGAALGRYLTGEYDITISGLDAIGNVAYQLEDYFDVTGHTDPNVFTVDVPAVSSQPTGGQGGLTLLWTFGGESCRQAAVTAVVVTIDGHAIDDGTGNTQLPCSQEGTDGVTISPLDAGPHTVELDAYAGATLAFTKSFTANVLADELVTLTPDLTAGTVTPSGATASVSWSFAGMSCAKALVDTVHVFVDGTDSGALPCSAGGVEGGEVGGLASGTHAITITGIRGTGSASQLVYKTSGAGVSADFLSGSSTHVIVTAAATSPGVGGATLTFAFPVGGPDCTTTTGAGTAVTYTLVNPAGTAQTQQTATCGGAGGSSGITICDPGAAGCGAGNAGLTAGVWSIAASASSGGTNFTSSTSFAVPNDAVGTATVSFAAQ